ncbi:MAG: hypothetical protein IKR34_03355, partial [Candidatus Gastranaerophilales bacterium]|nr:hypothetical protein [Candidatus Gastranaerophilales bacterium]
MDLSINNRNISNKNISFKGFESSYNKKGQRTFDFFIPPKYVQSLGKDESIVLEFALYNNKTGKIEETYSEKFPEGSNKVSLNEDDVKYITQNSDGLLYRFKIGDKIIYDETE